MRIPKNSPPNLGGEFLLCLTLFLVACGRPADVAPRPGPPQRIISVVPSATEMLFAFGLGDKVVAVGDYDRFPPEVETKPRIGGLINPNIEKIIELKPDLVITYGTQDVLRERLASVGVRFHPFVHGNAEHTIRYIEELGKVVGAENRALEIASEIRNTFDDIRARTPAKRPKVLLVHNRGAGVLGSFYTVGSKAFQHELIEIAGGENLFGEIERETLQPSVEEIIKRSPDIIIETLSPPMDDAHVKQRKADWKQLGFSENRVFILGETYYLVPGPRLHLAARGLAELIQGR